MPPPRLGAAGAAALLTLAACGDGGGDGNATKSDGNSAPAAPRVQIRPGLWEVSSEILSASEQGLPSELAQRARGRRQVARHCITAEQAARPDGNVLMLGRSGGCTHEGFDMSGGRIADTMTCRAQDGAVTRARAQGRYGPDAYAMQMEIETPGLAEGRTMRLVTRQTGRRRGECPAAPETGNGQ